MVQVMEARMEHVDTLCMIDKEVIGDNSRSETIKKAVEERRCIICKMPHSIAGFLIFTIDFFECSFISFVIVKPSERRKGLATLLLIDFVKRAPTAKIFSSTNRSNSQMQKVFETAGFKRSGYIENLDDDDPEIVYFISKVD